MPCGATQDGRVMVERSDRIWSTGEGNGKPLHYSCLENPISMKRQNDRILKEELPRSVPNMLLEIRGEITSERMKRESQSKNNTQVCRQLVIEAKEQASFNFKAAVIICSEFGAPKYKVSHFFSPTVSPSVCHEVMRLDAMILVL